MVSRRYRNPLIDRHIWLMQLTFTFEAHELPAVLAQLLKMAGTDASAIVAAAQQSLATDAGTTALAAPQPLPTPGVVVPATDTAPAIPAAEPKARKPRGRPRNNAIDPNLSAVPAADLPPPVVLATSPTAPADGSPAAAPMPVAAVAPLTTAVPPSPLPAAATGAHPSIDDVRSAYVAAEMRGAPADEIVPVLAQFGVTRVSLIPPEHRAAAIARFSAMRPASSGQLL